MYKYFQEFCLNVKQSVKFSQAVTHWRSNSPKYALALIPCKGIKIRSKYRYKVYSELKGSMNTLTEYKSTF